MITEIADRWQAQGANLSTYEFARKLQLHHDIIDPGQPYQKTANVYPRLIKLVHQSLRTP